MVAASTIFPLIIDCSPSWPPILQGDDDGLRDDEDSELEYDALNDETFGAAIKEDWEDLHENLVQLDRTGGPNHDDHDEDSEHNNRDTFQNLGKVIVVNYVPDNVSSHFTTSI